MAELVAELHASSSPLELQEAVLLILPDLRQLMATRTVSARSPCIGAAMYGIWQPLATALGRKLFASSTLRRTGNGGICCMTPCKI